MLLAKFAITLVYYDRYNILFEAIRVSAVARLDREFLQIYNRSQAHNDKDIRGRELADEKILANYRTFGHWDSSSNSLRL